MKITVISAIFLVLFVCIEIEGLLVCPQCICVPEYNLVCGRLRGGDKLKTFNSPCALKCNNMCRVNKFDLIARGRCEKLKNPKIPVDRAPSDR